MGELRLLFDLCTKAIAYNKIEYGSQTILTVIILAYILATVFLFFIFSNKYRWALDLIEVKRLSRF